MHVCVWGILYVYVYVSMHVCVCGLCMYVYVGRCVNAGVWRPEAKLEFLGYYPLFSFETHWPGAQQLLCQ